MEEKSTPCVIWRCFQRKNPVYFTHLLTQDITTALSLVQWDMIQFSSHVKKKKRKPSTLLLRTASSFLMFNYMNCF